MLQHRSTKDEPAELPGLERIKDIAKRIAQTFDSTAIPGWSMALLSEGRPVLCAGYGLASLEAPECMTASTSVRIGSLTKHFTCAAALLLQERNRLNVDEELARFVPELKETAAGVTLRQLMTNTSGLRDMLALASQFRPHLTISPTAVQLSQEDILELYAGSTCREFDPQTSWRYNNGGFWLLSLALERATEKDLGRLMAELIFEPLGLYQTRFSRSDTSYDGKRASTHHFDSESRGYQKAYFTYDYSGAGDIISSAADMARWVRQFRRPSAGYEILSTRLLEPQPLKAGPSSGYASGLRFGSFRGRRTISHGGGWVGSRALLVSLPECDLDLVLLGARDDFPAAAIADELLGALLPDGGRHVGADAEWPGNGIYVNRTTGRLLRTCAGPEGASAEIDAYTYPLQATRGGAWQAAGQHGFQQVRLTFNGNGSVELSEFGRSETFVPAGSGKAKLPCAIYRCAELGVDARIRQGELETSWKHGRMRFALEPVGAGAFIASPLEESISATILPDPDCSGFLMSNVFAHGLRFDRCETQADV
jgi:CubicO group peptidase (beta-lactamase class C family)